MCNKNNISLSPKLEMESFWLITDFVKKGTGIGYSIKEFLTKEFENDNIFEVKTNLNIKPRDIVVTTLENTTPSFATKVFIKEIQEYYR